MGTMTDPQEAAPTVAPPSPKQMSITKSPVRYSSQGPLTEHNLNLLEQSEPLVRGCALQRHFSGTELTSKRMERTPSIKEEESHEQRSMLNVNRVFVGPSLKKESPRLVDESREDSDEEMCENVLRIPAAEKTDEKLEEKENLASNLGGGRPPKVPVVPYTK